MCIGTMRFGLHALTFTTLKQQPPHDVPHYMTRCLWHRRITTQPEDASLQQAAQLLLRCGHVAASLKQIIQNKPYVKAMHSWGAATGLLLSSHTCRFMLLLLLHQATQRCAQKGA